jgi:hypothetical protein
MPTGVFKHPPQCGFQKGNKEGNKGSRFFGKHHSKKTREKVSKALQGSKSFFWNGGLSYLPYSIDWTRSLRISIRERDKYTCQLCGKKQGDRAFDVHHIDYNKLNCNSDNLITLCNKCHRKTNFNRKYWIIFFNK